jgi:PAS domain S-box-containing protein
MDEVPQFGDVHGDELRERLAAIVDSSDDAIVSKTLDGVITSWNGGAERLFGFTAAEAIGQHIYLIIPDDRREEEEGVLATLRRGGRVDHFETLRRRKDGRLVPISLTVSPIRNGTGRIVGASKVGRDISERKLAEEVFQRAREELEDRVRERTADLMRANESLRLEVAERQQLEEQRRQLLTRLALAQEDERRRIARELHDQLGQQLTALRLTLEMLKAQSGDRKKLQAQLETLEALARQLDQDVAFRVWELRPNVLETQGLRQALTNYVQSWSSHFGIRVNFHAGVAAEESLGPEVDTTIYRLAQEALNNVVKHARADVVDVVLERSANCLSLVIEDNGVGFDQSESEMSRGLGLIGMRERAALIGAELEIESESRGGTTVILRVPLVAPAVKTS